MQVKYVSHHMTQEQEMDPIMNKFMLLHVQSGNSCGIKGMGELKEKSRWHAMLESHGKVFFLIPPYRPMEASVPFGMAATKNPNQRAWGWKNSLCSKSGDPKKFGSGQYHAFPSGMDGVMIPGFAEAVLTSTKTHCIKDASTRTNTSDRICHWYY